MSKVANELMTKELFEVSVADIYFYSRNTGMELFTGTLTQHEITQSVDEEDIKAGRDNAVLATIKKNKQITFTLTDVISRLDQEAFQFGGVVKDVDGNVEAMHMPKNYTVAGGKVTLDKTPLDGEEVKVYSLKTNKEIPSVLAGNVLTLTGAEEGEIVFVGGFKYVAPEGAKYYDIAADPTTEAMFAVIEVPIYDSDMNLVALKQYHFPKVSMSGNVTKSGQSEKTTPAIQTEVKVLKDNSVDYLGRVIMLMEDEGEAAPVTTLPSFFGIVDHQAAATGYTLSNLNAVKTASKVGTYTYNGPASTITNKACVIAVPKDVLKVTAIVDQSGVSLIPGCTTDTIQLDVNADGSPIDYVIYFPTSATMYNSSSQVKATVAKK